MREKEVRAGAPFVLPQRCYTPSRASHGTSLRMYTFNSLPCGRDSPTHHGRPVPSLNSCGLKRGLHWHTFKSWNIEKGKNN